MRQSNRESSAGFRRRRESENLETLSRDSFTHIPWESIKLLKTLAADPRLGATIQAVLDEDTVWDSYKAQEHDLFLAPDAERGLLTSNSAVRQGLLT